MQDLCVFYAAPVRRIGLIPYREKSDLCAFSPYAGSMRDLCGRMV